MGTLLVDRYDAVALVGLAGVTWGLWWIWPPLAPLIIGVILLLAGSWQAGQEVNRRGSANKNDRTAGDD